MSKAKTMAYKIELNKTYLSNNPCLPGQLFHVTGFEQDTSFGKVTSSKRMLNERTN